MGEKNMKNNKGLYETQFEHDNCGIGAVVSIKGRQSHKVVDDALKIVEKLEHRAGKDAEGKTGDGVGIMLQVSHTFFKKAAAKEGIELNDERDYGVGMFFFPQDTLKRNQAKKMFEIITEKEGLKFLGWRTVPVDPSVLSEESIERFQSSQGELSQAIGRLLMITENYPDLKANQNFRDLQAQLEGTENRISTERMKFNETARAYNTMVRTFPNNIIASMFGFSAKGYFKAAEGAETAPAVEF